MSHLVSFLARANRGEGKKWKKREEEEEEKKKKKREKKYMYVFVLESCVIWVFGMISRVFHGD